MCCGMDERGVLSTEPGSVGLPGALAFFEGPLASAAELGAVTVIQPWMSRPSCLVGWGAAPIWEPAAESNHRCGPPLPLITSKKEIPVIRALMCDDAPQFNWLTEG